MKTPPFERAHVLALACTAMVTLGGTAAESETRTALYLDRTVSLAETLPDPTDLWVRPADLTRVNGFELKPEGACLDDLCIPLEQGPESSRDDDIVLQKGDDVWFSLTGFAERVGQAWVSDAEDGVWSFGTIPVARSSFHEQALAPDFALEDRNGEIVRLSDFRGKKVLIVTWASW